MTRTSTASAGVVLRDVTEGLIEDPKTLFRLGLGDCARWHHVQPVEVDERHQATALTGTNELRHRRVLWPSGVVGHQHLAGLSVFHQVERPEDTHTSHLADHRMALGQLTEARAD